MGPAILLATALLLACFAVQALAAAGLVRVIPVLRRRAGPAAPFRGNAAALAVTVLALHVAGLTQITLWGGAFWLCGEFADFEAAFYHSADNFTSLGHAPRALPGHWHLLGPLETLNGSLMLGLSTAMLFAVLVRIGEARYARPDAGPDRP
jgi:hypothetical protein